VFAGRGQGQLAIIALNPTLTFAASVADFRGLSQEKKFYYVSGFLDGFALAAQVPAGRAALLQKCFADFGTTKVLSLVEKWAAENPEKARQPETTIRAGLYVALAEACGWAKQ
jgi:hypothetical protein